ncbi:MAG: AAA-like domain-containing protein [Chloroflexota bacterium]
MPTFTSYGIVDPEIHYHVPRTELIDRTLGQLIGETPEKGGHYITVWAPRQAGKSWVLHRVRRRIHDESKYDWIDAVEIDLQDLEWISDPHIVIREIASRIFLELGIDDTEHPLPEKSSDFHQLFTAPILKRPLILIMDEFDALQPQVIKAITGVLRNIYIRRQKQSDKGTTEKYYLLHGVALIGVRSVLGIENQSGSPFNTQRSINIPNLTEVEVNDLFQQYIAFSGQAIEQDVINRIYYEFRGQPGLTCWFGELMTEKFNSNPRQPFTIQHFNPIFIQARDGEPNSNIMNLVKKANDPVYKGQVLQLFQTSDKIPFSFDDEQLNFLYMNGVIDYENGLGGLFVKYPNPFIQKRLFNSFAREMFGNLGRLHNPFIAIENVITDTSLNIPNLLKLYENYLQEHRASALKDAPLRADLHIHEATFHFHLYKYLVEFMQPKGGNVVPEFPTGNGKIDLLIHHAGQVYGLEVKSFSDSYEYRKALEQTAKYANSMGWPLTWLVFFTEQIDEPNRAKYQVTYRDPQTHVVVEPIFIELGTA